LQKFTGTIVFVSHDRYFLENVATRVFEIENGEVRIYPGNYADYLWRKQGGAEQTPTLNDVLIGVPPAVPIPMPSAAPPAKRINPMKLQQMRNQAKEMEDRIAELESEIQTGELALSNYPGPDEALKLVELLAARRQELEDVMNRWEDVSQQIEATA
ncbi:MAG: ABC transporter ATP-binding protein, partial [Bryobacteraceae bacterium]